MEKNDDENEYAYKMKRIFLCATQVRGIKKTHLRAKKHTSIFIYRK